MSSTHKLYAYLHEEILPLESAYLHVSDLSIQRGYGIFDFFKTLNGQPLFLEEYLNRFYASALLMGLQVPLSEEELTATLTQLIQMNGLIDSGVKMILTGGYSANGYDPGPPNLIILQQPLTMPSEAQLATGIKVITHDYVRELAAAKTINYTVGIRLIQQIKAKGADDVLYHQNGVVSEFPRSNFFLVKEDGTLVTPAREILHGVTRKNVLELARKKYKVEEGTITLEDIAQAKEAFMTSTTKRILPIVEVDGKSVGNGKPGTVSLDLLQDLIALEEAQIRAL
ncbi:aminotransferase class IV [Rufibacter glacialis]|uniref:branched-chain-amino-acid transaminase n=1 Tax=Rufibacter glacialis TaxID=1259555 RepID=A0A5M8QDH8_9BACT|nr:aminotransferase class IV [Rufibacter glacialis]KAA6432482.1 amino acid aminotransferase [Rufibacter glacialis]GGK79046.1 branched chain amino acid aminotransferase [Rufibacter glacialis]